MRNVVFLEIRSIINGLEPELAQCLALRVRPNYALEPNETRKANPVQTFGVKNSRSVPYTLRKI